MKSLERIVGGPRGPRLWRERLLKQKPGPNGYRCIALRLDGQTVHRTVHTMVMDAFIGPHPGKGFHVCHNNGRRDDNRLINLRYDTEVANHRDAIRHGTTLQGERHPGHKLTRSQVRDIRARYAEGGKTYRALADLFNVAPGTIGHIIRKTTWSWLD